MYSVYDTYAAFDDGSKKPQTVAAPEIPDQDPGEAAPLPSLAPADQLAIPPVNFRLFGHALISGKGKFLSTNVPFP